MISPLISSRRGFSILMALGATGVLLIIVIGMVSVFLTDMRLSRLQYDSILSSTQAEWAFEYAMLKVKNHRDGFADAMTTTSPDARIFSWASARTDKVAVAYTIDSQSVNTTFSGWLDRYTIIPLFTGKCDTPMIDLTSCNPIEYTGSTQVQNIIELSTWNPANLSWSIVAMSGSENVSISGTGNIWVWSIEIGTMRLADEKCFASDGSSLVCVDSAWVRNPNIAESLPYFYDLTGSTADFLTGKPGSKFAGMNIKDPYILIFSSWPDADITLKTNSPFTLPEMRITTEARKWDALQSIRFTEDKSRYYDALKYGVYNKN